jgi:hypothetical protein
VIGGIDALEKNNKVYSASVVTMYRYIACKRDTTKNSKQKKKDQKS